MRKHTVPHYVFHDTKDAYCQYCLEGIEVDPTAATLREREVGECVNCQGEHTPIDPDYWVSPQYAAGEELEHIKILARRFEALGGMGTDTKEAHHAHEALATAIDSASDYRAAYSAAAAIIDSFDY